MQGNEALTGEVDDNAYKSILVSPSQQMPDSSQASEERVQSSVTQQPTAGSTPGPGVQKQDKSRDKVRLSVGYKTIN